MNRRLLFIISVCLASATLAVGADSTSPPLKPYGVLSPPADITPAMTREPYSWSFPNEGNPDPNAPGRLPRRTWTPQERRTYEASVQWFHQAKYGIFFHFLSEFSSPDGSPWKPETWTKWVDFLVEYTKDYRVNFTKALKHGNPEAIVASGTLELSDYLHGHCMPDWNRQSKVVMPFFGRWDPDFNIQWHVFQHIGPAWAEPGCNKKTEELVKYAADVVKGGGVITFDLATNKKVNGKAVGPFLEIQPDQFKVLEAVRDSLEDIAPSEGSGK